MQTDQTQTALQGTSNPQTEQNANQSTTGQVTTEQFFSFFSFFNNPQYYPPAIVETYLKLALNFVPADRWGETWAYGVSLVCAHLLTIYRMSMNDIAKGGSGNVVGVVTSVSAIGVSKGINVDIGSIENGGFWNTTQFGRQYLTFVRLFGFGVKQLGVGFAFGFFDIPTTVYGGKWILPIIV